MNNRSDNELANLCASDNLSLGALQRKINTIRPRLSSQNPSCLHKACYNEKVTLEIIQLLYNTLPGALRLRDNIGCLPIHWLCRNRDSDENTSLDILRFMLDIDPNLPREVDGNGDVPILVAIRFKSTAFCKILIDKHRQSLRIETESGLPIHHACSLGKRDDTADTIQYMLELDPELINVEDSDGYLPIHLAAMNGRIEPIELLLKFDPDAASKETNDGSRRGSRLLPLHLASYKLNLGSIQVLYDAYPDAILARDDEGDTPLDDAQRRGNQPTIDFLQTQLVYARQAQDMTDMTTVDDDGWLPLHRALNDDAPLGSLKLLVNGNPDALNVADQKGAYPLHIACKFSSVKVVKYLVELAGDTLNNIDANEDSPLHYACRGGNCDVVNYLLEANVPSVSERNNEKKLAINLLFECGENILDRDSLEYIETIHRLLLANPEVVRDFMSH